MTVYLALLFAGTMLGLLFTPLVTSASTALGLVDAPGGRKVHSTAVPRVGGLAIVGAAAALAISDLPFTHILGGVRVGMLNGKYIANPTYSEGRESKLNIVVAGTEDGIVMVEAGAGEASEDEVLGAIEFGHDCCKKIAAAIRRAASAAGASAGCSPASSVSRATDSSSPARTPLPCRATRDSRSGRSSGTGRDRS